MAPHSLPALKNMKQPTVQGIYLGVILKAKSPIKKAQKCKNSGIKLVLIFYLRTDQSRQSTVLLSLSRTCAAWATPTLHCSLHA